MSNEKFKSKQIHILDIQQMTSCQMLGNLKDAALYSA